MDFNIINRQETFSLGEINYDTKYKGENLIKHGVITTFTIFSSDIETNIIRKYQKVQELLAQMGGFCNFLFLIAFALAKIENSYNLIILASNDLFLLQSIKQPNFSSKNDKDMGDSTDSLTKNHSSPKNNENKSPLNIEQTSKMSMIRSEIIGPYSQNHCIFTQKIPPKIVNEEVILNEKFEDERKERVPAEKLSNFAKLKNIFSSKAQKALDTSQTSKNLSEYLSSKKKQHFFNLGCWGYAKLLIKQKRFSLTNKEKLFLKAENQIMKEFDILHIIRKLQEINKLKHLLLNDDQMVLFNLLSKPMIVLDENDSQKDEAYRYKSSVGKTKNLTKDKISNIYKGIKAKVETNSATVIDAKIITFLDEDVLKYMNPEE